MLMRFLRHCGLTLYAVMILRNQKSLDAEGQITTTSNVDLARLCDGGVQLCLYSLSKCRLQTKCRRRVIPPSHGQASFCPSATFKLPLQVSAMVSSYCRPNTLVTFRHCYSVSRYWCTVRKPLNHILVRD